jgi:hypothetical protein
MESTPGEKLRHAADPIPLEPAGKRRYFKKRILTWLA